MVWWYFKQDKLIQTKFRFSSILEKSKQVHLVKKMILVLCLLQCDIARVHSKWLLCHTVCILYRLTFLMNFYSSLQLCCNRRQQLQHYTKFCLCINGSGCPLCILLSLMYLRQQILTGRLAGMKSLERTEYSFVLSVIHQLPCVILCCLFFQDRLHRGSLILSGAKCTVQKASGFGACV